MKRNKSFSKLGQMGGLQFAWNIKPISENHTNWSDFYLGVHFIPNEVYIARSMTI